MKHEKRLSAFDYLTEMASQGRYSFSSSEARRALGGSPAAVKLALNRLRKQRFVASPGRGFYTIVPPEYRALGSLPADQFIPALLERQHHPYYVGLLSAAQYHGAAHQQPQVFQVMVARARRPLLSGAVKVAFYVRKNLADVPKQPFNTPRGTILVSSPEATALDLVGYHDRVGGLDQVATVLTELADSLDPQKLAAAAPSAPLPWSQRLGYLLEVVDARAKATELKKFVQKNTNAATSLAREIKATGRRNGDWKLDVNVDVEPDI